MITTHEPVEWVKHAATCHKCGKHLVLNQDPECPDLLIEKWLPLIVCERCGTYLKEYTRIDDAMAKACADWNINRKDEKIREKLTNLTQRANRLFCRHWVTQFDWSSDWVDLLLEKPETCRQSMRWQERSHRKAREEADAK